MIKKFKKKRTIAKQDRIKPKSIDDLLVKYDLDNTDIIEYLDYLVDYLNERGV